MLEGPRSGKDSPLVEGPHLHTLHQLQGPGEAESPRVSVPIVEAGDQGPGTESADAFPGPLPRLPTVFGWR